MTRIAFVVIAASFASHAAFAGATWSTMSITTTPSNVAQVVAATDELMNSEVGKTFPGRLLLQTNVVDGANPATHTFVPIYKDGAQREAFQKSLEGNAAWTEFQGVLEKTTQSGGTVLYQILKRWGDINDTDRVWMVRAFAVTELDEFTEAVDTLMASETGKKFPGQVYLSAVVAGGMSPVTHVLSVGYDSESEMADWSALRDASGDWAAYQRASRPTAELLGSSVAHDIKTWGGATLEELSAP